MKRWWWAGLVLVVAGVGIGLWFLLRPPASAPVATDPGAAVTPGPATGTPSGTGGPPGGEAPVANPGPALFPQGNKKASHWFLALGPEGMGIPRAEWIRLRMTTPHLGVPRAGENPTVLPAFDYVTVTNPVGKTSEDNGKRAMQLLDEARRQKIPSMAHLMGLSGTLDPLEKDGGKQPLEFLIPVPPNTRVEPPLVVRRMPELRVWAMTSGVSGLELGKALQTMVQEVQEKGLRIVAPILGRYEGEDWLDALEKGSGEQIRVYLVVEGG